MSVQLKLRQLTRFCGERIATSPESATQGAHHEDETHGRIASAHCRGAEHCLRRLAGAGGGTAQRRSMPADTAWMISATALVLMMTIPGLALFYCGMVRKKNVLATMAQSLACVGLCSILWFAVGYSLSFVGDGPWLGTFERVFLRGIGMESTSAVRADHPRSPVHVLPDDVRDHHGRAGRGRGRRPHAVLRVPVVRRRLAAPGLCADRALGLGRRLPRQGRRARFRRRHRGPSQRRRRRPGRRLRASASATATAPTISRPTTCRWR